MLPVTTSIDPWCGAFRTTSIGIRILSASSAAGAAADVGEERILLRLPAERQIRAVRLGKAGVLQSFPYPALVVVDRREVAVGGLLVEEQRQRFAAPLEAAIELRVGLRERRRSR